MIDPPNAVNPAFPALIAFLVVVLLGKPTINWLAGLKMRQSINTDAPASHMAKQGTPTMGGILFLFGVLAAIAALALLGDLPQGNGLFPLGAIFGVFVLHLGLGFLDDYLKATRGKSLGLKARQKLIGQLVIAALFVLYLTATSHPAVTNVVAIWHGVALDIPKGLYYLLVVLMMIGFSNFTNLTDGLDGLAGGLGVLALIGLSSVLVPGYGTVVALFGWSLAGAILGFLVYNVNPAKVFMGDTGSLALGSTLAAIAILGKQEIALFIFGLVFVAEGVSVMLQVGSFKTRGKRIFKMAPIHHHFELIGWKETQVVFRFWIAGAAALLLGLLASQGLSPWRW